MQKNTNMLQHYRKFSLFTFPGCYQKRLNNDMPNDVREIGDLVRSAIIHRSTLEEGNTGSNADLKYGDMTKIPWWQQAQDDYLVTAGAMLTELYRKDKRGFVKNKTEQQKLIVTCRFVAILMASILKSKGIACRVRSGFAPYFQDVTHNDKSCDHWINQYWSEKEKRWVTIDVDGSWHNLPFDPYDMPENVFDFSADAWRSARNGTVDENHFCNAGGYKGRYPIAWELIYDFHSLMNNEIIYLHGTVVAPLQNYGKKPIDKKMLKEIDQLAKLMQDPDTHFDTLKHIWETNRTLRLLKGALL